MFFRRKLSGRTEYLQILKNDRVDGRPRQSVVATLGRAEKLAQNGTLEDRLIAAGHDFEWADIVQDRERLCEIEIEQDGKIYFLRNPAPACPLPRTWGVALPPLVRKAQPPPAPPLRKPQKRCRKRAEYLKHGRKDEAAVIAGIVFEDTIRRICRVLEIPENRVPLEALIAELVKRDAITELKAKRARAAAGLRTSAAHAR